MSMFWVIPVTVHSLVSLISIQIWAVKAGRQGEVTLVFTLLLIASNIFDILFQLIYQVTFVSDSSIAKDFLPVDL